MINTASIDRVISRLKTAQSILFITGAGMSVDSGLPTYRGVGGLYEGSATEDGIPIEMALAGETLRTRPEITWKYLSQIESNCRKARFNAGHRVLAQMEAKFPRVWTLTQNIDGFHTQAGSRQVIEIHGNMHRLRCDECFWHTKIQDFTEIAIPPQCPQCKEVARPDVVFFGEMLPEEACRIYERELKTGFDAYIWIGTSAIFPYIQHPLQSARRFGALTVEIDPAVTEISDEVDVKIQAPAAQVLERIWEGILADG